MLRARSSDVHGGRVPGVVAAGGRGGREERSATGDLHPEGLRSGAPGCLVVVHTVVAKDTLLHELARELGMHLAHGGVRVWLEHGLHCWVLEQDR